MADIDLNEMIASSDESSGGSSGEERLSRQGQSKTHHESHAHASRARKAQGKSHDVREPSRPSSSAVWVLGIVSVVLLALLVASILTKGFGAGASGVAATVSSDVAKTKTLAYLQGLVPGQTVTVDSVTDTGSLYSVKLSVAGKPYDSFVSKDGKYLFPAGYDMTQQAQAPDAAAQAPAPVVPKTAKPQVDLFVMAYCPYGTMIEKGMLPVIKTLGDKVDFNVRFVYYAMHGQKEVTENLNQYCIQKDQPAVYQKYLACFLNASDSAGCIKSTGVDATKMAACAKAADAQFNVTALFNDRSTWLKDNSGNPAYPLFGTDRDLNMKYGVGGSPALVINGVQANTGRDSASLLRAICGSFTNAPAECNTQLSSTTPGPGFGYDSTAAATAAGCGV